MPVDLAALLALQNAWRAYGVPVVGDRYLESDCLWLYLKCGRCDTYDEIPLSLLEREDGVRLFLKRLRALLAELKSKGCEDLARLLGKDPPEVVALTKLELLAGDPPR
jgi:hypothetical protein